MLFNSYAFLFAFLPATLLVFYGLRLRGRADLSVPFLMLASVAFYAYWKPSDTLVLVATIVWNFMLARRMTRVTPGAAKSLLMLGVSVDLGLLFYYKYVEFVLANVSGYLGWHFTPRGIVMPIGISFFTFTQIAYLVDSYRSRECEESFTSYSLFVTIFPHLIAGPIIHHAHMRPQFSKLRREPVLPSYVVLGTLVFIAGLAKKVLIADNLVTSADVVFNAAEAGGAITAAHAWLGTCAYTLQIYFDFSGYSDMAIGLGLLFGLRLPLNFDSPYKSTSIIEFWRRWHITLSTWLRDYLYISLGGNRGGEWRRLRNVGITMLLGGIWHGAGWTFVIWGALHATYIVINHVWRKLTPRKPAADGGGMTGLKWASSLLLVMLAWVFFRAQTVTGAMAVLASMASLGPHTDALPGWSPLDVLFLVSAASIALLAPNTQQIFGYSPELHVPLDAPGLVPTRDTRIPASSLQVPLVFGVLFAAVVACIWRPATFIYFNF